MFSYIPTYEGRDEINFGTLPSFESTEIGHLALFERLTNFEQSHETLKIALRHISYLLDSVPNLKDTGTNSCAEILPQLIKQQDIAQLTQQATDISGFDINSEDKARFVITQYTPLGHVPACWLRNISSPATNHLDFVSPLHDIFFHYVGKGDCNSSFAHRVYQVFMALGIGSPNLRSKIWTHNGDIRSWSFAEANAYLSIGLFPRVFTPEILGITLFQTLMPVPGAVLNAESTCNALIPNNFSLASLCQSLSLEDLPKKVLTAISLFTKQYNSNTDAADLVEKRIVNGFLLAKGLRCQWQRHIGAELQTEIFSPHLKMVRLVQEKAPYAIGYHSRIRVNQKPLDDLMEVDAEQAVIHLAKSKYIKPGDPDNSRLITKSIAFGGSMFRIFTNEEVKIIRDWISSLAVERYEEKVRLTPLGDEVAKLASEDDIERKFACTCSTFNEDCIRSLYHTFLNIEFNPGALPYAKTFAESWLTRCEIGIERGECPLPFSVYSHQRLQSWFDELAQSQLASYNASESKDISKDALIDASLQLCPMIFIDGAWLQKWSEPTLNATKIGAALYGIYSDEVGNGVMEWNHPNLYRALMDDMGVSLPDFRTQAFAQLERFNDDAFQVPVFWLSVSLFPNRFTPELLGLNLAMELSGVGGSYRVAKDQLKQHGFSTLFVDLHNTIDNVSTGHSAIALNAIKMYMEDVLKSGRSEIIYTHWKRIWTGYRALVPPKGIINFIHAKLYQKLNLSVSAGMKNKPIKESVASA